MYRKVFALIFSAVLILGTVCPAYATSTDTTVSNNNVLNDVDLTISEEVAYYIAEFFLEDAVLLSDVRWTSDTIIEDCVLMYDADDNISAYTFELSSGYIVVGAYIDLPSYILEWSDSADPCYYDLNLSNTEHVVYLGALDYYKVSENGIFQDVLGNTVDYSELIFKLNENRSLDNIPTSIMQALLDDLSTSSTNSTISDPYTYAANLYGGTFTTSSTGATGWSTYIKRYKTSSFTTTSSGTTVKNHCGPVAITNIIASIRSRKGLSSITSSTLFSTVAEYGLSNGYYTVSGGTPNSTANTYIKACCSNYSITVTLSSKLTATFSNIKSRSGSKTLLYVMLSNNSTYGNHAVVAYNWLTLMNASSVTLNFAEVADGWSSSARYLDISTFTSSDTFYAVTYS